MIFQHTLEQVLSGKKTQTRRRIKPDKRFVYRAGCVKLTLTNRLHIHGTAVVHNATPAHSNRHSRSVFGVYEG